MLRSSTPGPAGRREGAIAVKVAVLLPALLAIVALAFDGGLLYDARRHTNAAADGAALAAAGGLFNTYLNTTKLDDGIDADGSIALLAEAVAAANGYPDDGMKAKVDVYIPPQSGPYAGKPGYAEVVVSYYQPRGFSAVFGKENLTVGGRAVARGRWIQSGIGILCLDPTTAGSLKIGGEAHGFVPNADVIVNSTSPAAAAAAGGNTTLSSEKFEVTGGIANSTQFEGPQQTGVPPTPDPYRDIPEPDPALLPLRYVNVDPNYKVTSPTGEVTHHLFPGVYKGGIKFTQGSVHLHGPGIFYMLGGGFSFSGQGSLTATKVMLFNDGGNNNGSISIVGQGAVSWTPMDAGIYAGITLWQKRGQTQTVSISGQGNMNITGALYVPDALLAISGSGVNYIGNQVICWQLSMQGNGYYYVPWDPNRLPRVRDLRLVE